SVPTAAATQDVGVFSTAHNTGAIGEADFDHFTLASQPGALASYEAEAPANVLGGAAAVRACPTCSGTAAVGGLGAGATVTFTGVTAPAAGSYRVTFVYLDGAAPSTQATMSVNCGPAQAVPFPASGNPYGVTVSLPLAA